MTPDTQGWSVYRPDALPKLSPQTGDEGRVIAVTATDQAMSRGWATEVALGLARGWSGSRLSVTLIDADIAAPTLHEALDVENGTGLTDVLFFGSSLDGVSHPVENGRFRFVTAGSPAAEPELAFQQERWPRICQQAVRNESTLLVFVPHSAPWSEAILELATDIVVLAATSSEADSDLLADTRVRAVLGVGGAESAPDESTDPLLTDPLEAVAQTDEAPAEEEVAVDDSSAAEVSHSPLEPTQPPPTRMGTRFPVRNLVWGSAIVLLVAVVVVQVVRRSSAAEPVGSLDTAPVLPPATEPAPEQTAPQPEAIGPAARFTVTLSAYRDLAMATARLETLAARTSDYLFILVPVEVGGNVFHRLQAGLAPDSATALAISDDLALALDEPSASWIVRDGRLAFEVGRAPSLVVATERRDEVVALALPAYVLGVEMSDGSMEYRVYVGAYADEGESGHMRSVLTERGLGDVALVPRFGTAVR